MMLNISGSSRIKALYVYLVPPISLYYVNQAEPDHTGLSLPLRDFG
jgi:hypothetical protein